MAAAAENAARMKRSDSPDHLDSTALGLRASSVMPASAATCSEGMQSCMEQTIKMCFALGSLGAIAAEYKKMRHANKKRNKQHLMLDTLVC